MSDNVREAVDWNSIAADAARFGRGGASIVAKRAREREAELLAALAAPSSESPAATGSGAAPTRDAVAEVLLREANRDLTGWTWAQLCESRIAGIVAAVALARRQADAILSRWSAPPAPRGEAVAHRPGHRPPVGWRAVVEIVSASDLEADDVIFAEGRWLCVLDDDLNDSTQVMAAEIIDDAGGRGVSDTTYGEWFARVVALVPQHEEP